MRYTEYTSTSIALPSVATPGASVPSAVTACAPCSSVTSVPRLQTDPGPNRPHKRVSHNSRGKHWNVVQFPVWFVVVQHQAHRRLFLVIGHVVLSIPFSQSQLLQRYRKRETYLEVNLGHVSEFRPQLLDMLTFRPVEYLPLFEQVSCF